MTIRKVLFTRDAVIAMLCGEPTCDTCRGRGRTEAHGRAHTCATCKGSGVPANQALTHTINRTERKANREVRA